eukprot:TRINITY_DN39576_c0_g1_i1.p1 TRINITY_DN39576_c0_g1~~TRINITY_DN39576_c0_g1_i1.p1  ORF type:complete len:195 (-),score=28.94 TRINITY_DN39576_c0_g1_i1:383-967(-)
MAAHFGDVCEASAKDAVGHDTWSTTVETGRCRGCFSKHDKLIGVGEFCRSSRALRRCRDRTTRGSSSSHKRRSLLKFVPQTQRLLSVGSKQHHNGFCRPCCFNTSLVACPAGMSCAFCHHDHVDDGARRVALPSRDVEGGTRKEEQQPVARAVGSAGVVDWDITSVSTCSSLCSHAEGLEAAKGKLGAATKLSI